MEVRIRSLTAAVVLVFLVLLQSQNVYSRPGEFKFLSLKQENLVMRLCDIESTQSGSSIILDIEESRGNQTNQSTIPAELPIFGDPNSEITLSLLFPKQPAIFKLREKRLQLTAPLDRDAENLSHVIFQVICTVRSTGKKKTLPVIVRVSDINDNAPRFTSKTYSANISELTAPGEVVFRDIKAVDADAGVNGLVEYFVVPGNGAEIGSTNGVGKDRVNIADGYGFFAINLPHQGMVSVNRSLDYEKTQRYLVTIVASDRARNQADRLSSTTTLTFNIKDDDDQNPSFVYQGCSLQDGACVNPQYFATVYSGTLSGVLSITPEKIQAIDMDSLNAPIAYSFASGSPSTFRNYFEINPNTGAVRQIRPVDVSQVKKFDISVKAEEVSESRRSTLAKLTINVKPVDSNPPVIRSSALQGFVDEASPIGTKVVDSTGKPIHLTVTDADLKPDDPKPVYLFELTTPSFAVSPEGDLVVNEKDLDRDPPNPGVYRFQIVAREKNINNVASAPISLAVTLNDLNDNAPRLPLIPPISLQAGETRRQITKVEATDNDLGENAEITYSIYHVSNNGLSKFVIDPKTGVLESNGKLSAGEQYSITVQATDKGGKYSQTIVEVVVTPGPNTRGPVFEQPVYDVVVSEGVSINTTVTSVHARDPESGPVIYSIVSGTNELREFGIDPKTGVISVIKKLDREQLTQYQLIIRAEDEDRLSSTTIVNIKVSDINDKNPEFINLPYEFIVSEGKNNAHVGQVKAIDADEGQNAVVYYSLPEDVPFIIDVNSGDIRTSIALDYETQPEYKFVVTAKDGATDPRLATATVTVKVTDVEDELPIFHIAQHEVKVPENVPDHTVIQVKADDPDTVKRITYVIRQGPTDLFAIDKNTGVVKTVKGLDYEKEVQHILIIGTVENPTNKPGATTKVIVNVEDVNDIPPIFLSVPQPITLDDDVPIGTKVTTLIATDSDGTSPNNKVRYEIVGRGKASKYFQIDPDIGLLQVRNDLRKETDNEYAVEVKAYDLGDPSLSSVATLPIFIRHVATVPPDVKAGFADDLYTVQVAENSPPNTWIKTFTVLNSKVFTNDIPLRCTIVSGNSENIFYSNVTADKNCELRIKEAKLDHEHEPEFKLKIRLDTLTGLVNPDKSVTNVNVQVTDVNDNTPRFIYPETSHRFAKQAYFGAIAKDKEVSSPVIQIKAIDGDSGKFGQIEYHFVKDDTGATKFFSIDPISGVIKTTRNLDHVPEDNLPFRLIVRAQDNPATQDNNTHLADAHVVINLIDDRHRMILVINDATPEVVKTNEANITRVLEEHAKLIVGVEKITPRQYRRSDNISLESDPNSTDLWFYTIDPSTEVILERNNSRVTRSILEPEAASNITLDVSGNLHVTASNIHGPLMVITPKIATVTVPWEINPYFFIILGAVILISTIAGIIYICISWSRYKAYKDRISKMYITPRYDPVFVDPHLKEYETQVLQMSVPVDDNDSYNDLQIDFSRKNHTFNLDNVGYISKENGNSSPTNSDAATTTRASSVSENHFTMNHNHHNNHNGTAGKVNRAYQR
ncbi:cadherin-99C isoform X2 [Planococcus citri]